MKNVKEMTTKEIDEESISLCQKQIKECEETLKTDLSEKDRDFANKLLRYFQLNLELAKRQSIK